MFSNTDINRQVQKLIEQHDSGVEVHESTDGKGIVISPATSVNLNQVDPDDDLVQSESNQFIANP